MNRLVIAGNLVREPVLSVANTVNGQVSVCRFSVAVSRRGKQKGETDADFFSVTAWRNLAEACGKYLHKGDKVVVEGSVSASIYTSRDGEARPSMDVSATDIDFILPKTGGGSFTPVAPETRAYNPPAQKPAQSLTPVDDPDNPFKPNMPDDYDPNDLPF